MAASQPAIELGVEVHEGEVSLPWPPSMSTARSLPVVGTAVPPSASPSSFVPSSLPPLRPRHCGGGVQIVSDRRPYQSRSSGPRTFPTRPTRSARRRPDALANTAWGATSSRYSGRCPSAHRTG